MFLNNYYKLIKASFAGKINSMASGIGVVNKDGNSFDPYVRVATHSYSTASAVLFPLSSQNLSAFVGTGNWGGFGAIFGTGATAPTVEDYKLENQITSGLSVSDYVTTKTASGNVATVHAMYTLTNTSSEDITVAEMGLHTPVAYSSSSTYGVIVDRTVLAEPVTISPGNSATIDYVFEFGLPAPPSA